MWSSLLSDMYGAHIHSGWLRGGRTRGAFGWCRNIVIGDHRAAHSFSGGDAGVGCGGSPGWSGSSAGGEVLEGVHARFVCEVEGRIVGSVFFIVVGHFLHVRHGATVTQLKSNHISHQVSILKKKTSIVPQRRGE